jgi:hypothetical protein
LLKTNSQEQRSKHRTELFELCSVSAPQVLCLRSGDRGKPEKLCTELGMLLLATCFTVLASPSVSASFAIAARTLRKTGKRFARFEKPGVLKTNNRTHPNYLFKFNNRPRLLVDPGRWGRVVAGGAACWLSRLVTAGVIYSVSGPTGPAVKLSNGQRPCPQTARRPIRKPFYFAH